MSTKENTAVAVIDPTQYALALPDKAELAEVLQENMENTDFKFERVKMPAGGITVWEVLNEDGETDNPKNIIGIIIDHYPCNAYWKKKFTGESNPPDCWSNDTIRGEGDPGGNCAKCTFNQYGSAPPDENGKESKGKACKNMHRIFVLRQGEIFPLMIALTPGSLENFAEYRRRLTNKLKKISGMVTSIGLEKAVSGGGITFSKATFARAAELDKETAKQVAEHSKTMKPFLRQIGITEDDYVAANGTSGSGGDAEGVDDLPAADQNFAGTTINMQGDQSAQPGGDTVTDPGKAW